MALGNLSPIDYLIGSAIFPTPRSGSSKLKANAGSISPNPSASKRRSS